MTARTVFGALIALLCLLGLESTRAFAEERRSSISGTVWFDANANGQPDSQERAVRNIEVTLDGQAYHKTVKTGDDGKYSFDSLPAGRYALSIKIPTGYGLSAGPDQEFTLDGLTAYIRVDLGIARADQLPPPTAVPAPGSTQPSSGPPGASQDRPGSSPQGPRPVLPDPPVAPGPPAPPIAPAPPSAQSQFAPPPYAPPPIAAPPAARQPNEQPTPTVVPTSTPQPTALSRVEPSATIVPTPTAGFRN